jgi:hypothetical protein
MFVCPIRHHESAKHALFVRVLPVGTQLALEVTSASGNGHPYAQIALVGGTSVTNRCDEPGCTARAELVVAGYCGL